MTDEKVEFTPGPWKVFKSADGRIVGIGREGTGEGVTDPRFQLWGDGDERDANAFLIAAAPDMYAALKGLIEREWQHAEETGQAPPASIAAGLATARAALSKAEGKS